MWTKTAEQILQSIQRLMKRISGAGHYLGDGQMLEAPDIGLKVRVAPVRTSGMTPYVVRYIEW
ncbi:hypothetical protein CKJ76_14470 [Mycobacterium avium]|nr:hypothetical protein CKJ76_14470 [Mycobacterium avium]